MTSMPSEPEPLPEGLELEDVTEDTPMPVMDDSALTWSLACNFEPKMVGRREAWRELYTRLFIERVGADLARIRSAERDCRKELADSHHVEY